MYSFPFDELAREYDAEFTDAAVGRALREIVWSRLDVLFHPGQRILELGCGTGEDAVHLARCGVQVVATDASAEMIDVASRKAQLNHCAERVEFHATAMEDIAATLSGATFDGVFSNFGAINCVRDLSMLAEAASRLLKPGAPLLWIIMGRRVPWEWAWYLLRGQASKAVRRYRRQGVEWRGMRIAYPAPAEVATTLRPYFSITRLSPLGCILPPSYAAAWIEHSPRVLAALTRIEGLAQRSSALASWSDHYILEANRLAPRAG